MRLMLHALKKDARRLWPVAGLTWIMLGALANVDRYRADWIASATESWMNVLLCAAWACLAALAVLEEPLVGDRHFWMTRPHRWPALLAAKLIFVALAIHAPSLLADGFVLAARGFSPVSFMGDLLWKQVLLFAGLTFPAIAVATLVRSFTGFVITLFAIAACIAMLSGGFQSFPAISRQPGEVRHALVLMLLAVGAVVVAWIQYARRQVKGARLIAVLGALAAAAVSAFLPMRAEFAGRGREAPSIALRSAPPDESTVRGWGRRGQATVALPVAITENQQASRLWVREIEIEIAAPNGVRIQSGRPAPNRPFDKIELMAGISSISQEASPSLVLTFSRQAWDRVKNERVRIRGWAGFEFYRLGETTILSAMGSGNVPGVGRCTSITVDTWLSESMLKVLCESPRPLPPTSVTLRHEPSGRTWLGGLNTFTPYIAGPHESWLSPLHRGQYFFRLTDSVTSAAGAQWLVPASYVSSARVEITPRLVTGRSLSRFDFDHVALASWLVSP
jgi:hypothetical protein